MNYEKSELNQETFEDDYTTAQEIAEQNQLYVQVVEDKDFEGVGEDFRSIVTSDLYDQQTDTIFYLANSHDDHQSYEDVALAYNSLESRLDELADQYKAATSDFEAYQTKLRMLAVKSLQLAPTKSVEIDKLLGQKIAEASYDNGSEILHKLQDAAYEFNTVRSLFDIASRPWPVPLIPRPQEQAAQDEPVSIEDEMPVDPKYTDETLEGRAKSFAEKYGYTTDASVYAAAFLMENTDKVLTPLEVGRAVAELSKTEDFTDVSKKDAEKSMHSRTLSLLNINTGKAPELLAQHGYLLQYVNRRMFSLTGKQIGHTRRAYRVIKLDDRSPDEFERFVDERVDAFDAKDIEADIPDIDQEESTTLEDVHEIELRSTMTRDERFEEKLQLLLSDIETTLPWLDEHKVLPEDRDGTLLTGYVSNRMMQLRASSKIQVPSVVSPSAAGKNHKDKKMNARQIVYALIHPSHKSLKKDKSRFDAIDTAVNNLLDEHYEQRSKSTEQQTPIVTIEGIYQ